MLFNIIFKQYLNIFIRNFVLCIQIRFVSTEKTTRIASRASCSNRSVQIWNAISSKLNINVYLYKIKYYVKLFLLENKLMITYYH